MALYFKDAMMDEELKEQDTSAHLQRMKKNLCSGMKDWTIYSAGWGFKQFLLYRQRKTRRTWPD